MHGNPYIPLQNGVCPALSNPQGGDLGLRKHPQGALGPYGKAFQRKILPFQPCTLLDAWLKKHVSVAAREQNTQLSRFQGRKVFLAYDHTRATAAPVESLASGTSSGEGRGRGEEKGH